MRSLVMETNIMAESEAIRERQVMRQVARRLRYEPTVAEARLWGLLRRKQCSGLRFLRQHDVGHYVLDFYCASLRLAVEVDGGVHDRPDVRENDRGRETVLGEQFGLRFLRLTNEEVMTLPVNVLYARILASSDSLPPAPSLSS